MKPIIWLNSIRFAVLLATLVSNLTILAAQDQSEANAQQEVGTLQTDLLRLQSELAEHRQRLKQSTLLTDEIERGQHELASLREKIKDRQRLCQALTLWTKASFVIGDNRSSRVMAIQEANDGWIVSCIATHPFQQYALVAAMSANVPCRSDVDCEALMKLILQYQPKDGSVPFVVHPSQLSASGLSSSVKPTESLLPNAPQKDPRPVVGTYQLALRATHPQKSVLVLGTAFPINKHYLATSGSRLSAIAENPELLSELILRSPGGDEPLAVRSVLVHPQFRAITGKQAAERQNLTSRLDQNPDMQEQLEIRKRLAVLDAAVAMFDVGVVEVESPVKSVLPISNKSADDFVTLHGWPLMHGRIFNSDIGPQVSSGQLVVVSPNRPLQMVIRSNDEMVWPGAPVIGRDGRVRGICAGPLSLYDVPGEQRFYVVNISELAPLVRL
jgi:hypothetical protein